MVLDSVADDYESLDMIIEEVAKWSTAEYIQVNSGEIIAVLGQLLQAGQVAAYCLTSSPKPEVLASVNLDALQNDTYFYITPDGRNAGARFGALRFERSGGDPTG